MIQQATLRGEAESGHTRSPTSTAVQTLEEMQRTLHELQVHQVELELQNAELRRSHAELDAARERYLDLYDLAPVGYVTLSEAGLILEANLTTATLLGVTRGALLGQPLCRFVVDKDAALYTSCRERLFGAGEAHSCELRMVNLSATIFWARLEGTAARDAHGAPVGRLVLSNITKMRQLEESRWIKNRVFDASMTANSIASFAGTITEVNEAFLRIWGYTCKQEVLGNPIPHFFMNPNEALPVLATLGDMGYWQGEFVAKRKDGSAFMARGLATVVHDQNGKLIGYQSSVVDISASKQAEEALRMLNERYREIFEFAVDGILQGTPEGTISGANAQMQKLAGRSLEQLLALHVSELFDPVELKANPLRFDLLNGAQVLVVERNLLRPDGTSLPVEMHSKRMPDGTYQSIYRDISIRKQAMEELHRSQDLLNTTQRLSKIGGWLWDIDQQTMFWTEEMHHLHEFVPGELALGSPEHITKSLTCYDPADQSVIMEAFRRCATLGEPYDLEFPFTTAKGRRLWTRTIARAAWDGGRIIKVTGTFMDITERKQAELALRDSNELLSLFMRHSPIYSFIKAVTPTESRVLHASENYDQITGIVGSQMAGKTMEELFPADLAAKINADDNAVVVSGKLMSLYEDFGGRNYFTIKFPIALENRTLLAGYTIDVTERKQTEQALREWSATLEQRVAERTFELKDSEARFRQLAEATFEGIAISEGGTLVDGNLRLAEIHGCDLAEMIGRPVTDFVAPESRAKVTGYMRDASEATYEFLGMRKDGSIFPLEAHGRTGIWMGRPTRISALRDLTAARQAEERLRRQQAELAHAQHLALVSEVSAGIIHQLGQPLSAIGANLSAMVRLKACEAKCCDSLAIIQDVQADVARMRDIVVHLRALANPMQPTRVAVDLNAIVTKVLPLLRQKAEIHRFRLGIALGTDLPTVHADAVQMSQVILNLVRNAFEAADACLPELREVHVTTRAIADQAVELCVRDGGTGIAPEAAARLFSPFFSTKPDGLGVGLRLSQTIVEAHGGSIEGHNNPDGVGATFRVVLPTRPPIKE